MSRSSPIVILSGTPRRIWPRTSAPFGYSEWRWCTSQILRRVRLRMTTRLHVAMRLLAVLAPWVVASAQTTRPATESRGQQIYLRETDPNSPRKSKLKSDKPDNEILRIDLDNDGDPDIL